MRTSAWNPNVPFPWDFILLLAVAAAIWGWFSANLVLRVARVRTSVTPATFGLAFDPVSFRSPRGTQLAGWFIPADRPSDRTIIVCHGWGSDKGNILPVTRFLTERGGYNLFYFDFTAHGESGGDYTSLGRMETEDLLAAVDHLAASRPERCKRMAVYGTSLGGSVAIIATALHERLEAVVAESPFSSFSGIVAHYARLYYHVPRVPFVPVTILFVRLRLGFDPDAYSAVRYAARLAPRPLFLIQGDRDVRAPVHEGELLYSLAREPKTLWTVPGADHGEVYLKAGREYEDRVLAFYGSAFR